MARPTELARHWISSNSPDSRGLKLDVDGTGRIGGTDPALDDGFIRWGTVGNKLRILFHGEEGEHGDYEEYTYILKGESLKLSPPIFGSGYFTVNKDRITSSKSHYQPK